MAKNLIKLFFSYSESEQIYAILLDIKKKYIREIWNGKKHLKIELVFGKFDKEKFSFPRITPKLASGECEIKCAAISVENGQHIEAI